MASQLVDDHAVVMVILQNVVERELAAAKVKEDARSKSKLKTMEKLLLLLLCLRNNKIKLFIEFIEECLSYQVRVKFISHTSKIII